MSGIESWLCATRTRKLFVKLLIGQKIATNYNQGATYIIADILWDKNPKITFPDPKNNNQEMSFAQYFKRKYGLEIKDMEQPMIVGMDECLNRVGVKRTLIEH